METERDLVKTEKTWRRLKESAEAKKRDLVGRGVMRMKLHRYAPSTEVINYKPFTNKACS